MTERPTGPATMRPSPRPVAALLDLLGKRWALRVVWELRTGGLGFNDLQRRCDGMSSSVLGQRLRELRVAGIVADDGAQRWELTRHGDELVETLSGIEPWAGRWAKRRSDGQ